MTLYGCCLSYMKVIVVLLCYALQAVASNSNETSQYSVRLFGTDVTSRGHGGLSASPAQQKYTQADLDRLNIRYDPDSPLPMSRLSEMSDLKRAQHSDPSAERMVRTTVRDADGNRLWRGTGKTNFEYINHATQAAQARLERKRARYAATQPQSRRFTTGRGMYTSENLKVRKQRARETGDSLMHVKDPQGQLVADPLGRTGSEYLKHLLELDAKHHRDWRARKRQKGGKSGER